MVCATGFPATGGRMMDAQATLAVIVAVLIPFAVAAVVVVAMH
jgi:hypothetical protein